ncbi:hypothetical protein PMIT1327_00001 [Prochlorococcus marinus str. MIT 1327]|nr:hypothetical protein PMIT1312_00156 [Prochlorococcus marinus str. MIT 1312]KZR85395.1 hypothetical protein PMIT1327_00001 [Prochlorococcus marinus str. MIT 1327]
MGLGFFLCPNPAIFSAKILYFNPDWKPLSVPLHPTSALQPLPLQLEFDSWRNPQLSTTPQSVHLTREMSCKLG